MFKKIFFYYNNEGVQRAEPLVLLPKHCNASSFRVWSTSRRLKDGEFPSLQINRNYLKLDRDPYNEDGKPPTCLFAIVHPHVSFVGGGIEVVGWEDPNLAWGGVLMEPYEGCPRRRGMKYMSKEKIREFYADFSNMNRQKILLIGD